MKKFSLTTLLIIITLGFSSCTQDDNTFLEEPTAEDLLKSFNLNKSVEGDFSLDYQLGKGAASDNILDEKTNTNNIYLYSSEEQVKSRQNQGLSIQNGELNVSFQSDEKRINSITILDNDIKLRGEQNEYLDSYGVSGDEELVYTLDFTVKDGIAVDIIFDGDRNVYVINLNQDDSASKLNFSETFTKEEGIDLKIEFMNNSRMMNRAAEPRPQVIIK